GHGNHEGIIPSDIETYGDSYKYNSLFSKFNNENLLTLSGKPKIYFMDCCRGENNLNKIISMGNKIIQMGEKIILSKGDEFKLWGTLENHKSFQPIEENKSTFFGKALYDVLFKNKLNNNQWNLNSIYLETVEKILQCGIQRPELKTTLAYSVKF